MTEKDSGLTEEQLARVAARAAEAVGDAYDRGYRRGRTEATAEARKFYAERIREAVAILTAPIPLPEKDA